MNGVPLLDLDTCRVRQRRLRERLAGPAPDLVVLTSPEHVQYLTGHRWDYRWARAPLAAIDGAPSARSASIPLRAALNQGGDA